MIKPMLSLPTLAKKIQAEYEACFTSAQDAVVRAIEVGRLLYEAKEQVWHGQWAGWVAANCPFGARQASSYMRVYANRKQIRSAASDFSSLRAIVEVLEEPKPLALSRDKAPEPSSGEGFVKVWTKTSNREIREQWVEESEAAELVKTGRAVQTDSGEEAWALLNPTRTIASESEETPNEPREIVVHYAPQESQERITTPWTKSQRERKAQVESGQSVTANQKVDFKLIEWAKERNLFVCIDRTTIWGNPFILDANGDRATVLDYYERLYFIVSSLNEHHSFARVSRPKWV
jgi:hypothetical protein